MKSPLIYSPNYCRRTKKIISVFIALVFLLQTCFPAWAREGNYGEKGWGTSTGLGILAGAVTVASAAYSPLSSAIGSIASDLADSYMYFNHYDSYGKELFSIGEVKITQSQAISMAVGITAGSAAGFISGGIGTTIRSMAEWVKKFLEAPMKTLAELGKALVKLIKELPGKLWSGVSKVGSKIWKSITDMFEAIGNMFKAIKNFFKEGWLGKLWGDIKTAFSNAWDYVKGEVKLAKDTQDAIELGEHFARTGESVLSSPSGFMNTAFGKFLSATWSVISFPFKAAWNVLSWAWGGIRGAWDSLKAWWNGPKEFNPLKKIKAVLSGEGIKASASYNIGLQHGLVEGLPMFLVNLAGDLAMGMVRLITSQFAKKKLEKLGWDETIAGIAADWGTTMVGVFLTPIVKGIIANLFGLELSNLGGTIEGKSKKGEGEPKEGKDGSKEPETEADKLEEMRALGKDASGMLQVDYEEKEIIDGKEVTTTKKGERLTKDVLGKADKGRVKILSLRRMDGTSVISENLSMEDALKSESVRSVANSQSQDGMAEKFAKVKAAEALLAANKDLMTGTGGLMVDVHGSDMNEMSYLEAGLRAVQNEGLSSLFSTAARILVLKALSYKTHHGRDKEKIFENLWKMAIANGAGNMMEQAVRNLDGLNKWYDGTDDDKSNIRRSKSPNESMGSFMLRQVVVETIKAGGTIGWGAFIKNNVDGGPNAITELGHLAISSVIGGMMDIFRQDPYEVREEKQSVSKLGSDGEDAPGAKPVEGKELDELKRKAGDKAKILGNDEKSQKEKEKNNLEKDKNYLVVPGENGKEDIYRIDSETEYVKVNPGDAKPQVSLTTGYANSQTKEHISDEDIRVAEVKGEGYKFLLSGKGKEEKVIGVVCDNDAAREKLKKMGNTHPEFTREFAMDGVTSMGRSIAEDFNNHVGLALLEAAPLPYSLHSDPTGLNAFKGEWQWQDKFKNNVYAAGQGAGPITLLAGNLSSTLASHAESRFASSVDGLVSQTQDYFKRKMEESAQAKLKERRETEKRARKELPGKKTELAEREVMGAYIKAYGEQEAELNKLKEEDEQDPKKQEALQNSMDKLKEAINLYKENLGDREAFDIPEYKEASREYNKEQMDILGKALIAEEAKPDGERNEVKIKELKETLSKIDDLNTERESHASGFEATAEKNNKIIAVLKNEIKKMEPVVQYVQERIDNRQELTRRTQAAAQVAVLDDKITKVDIEIAKLMTGLKLALSSEEKEKKKGEIEKKKGELSELIAKKDTYFKKDISARAEKVEAEMVGLLKEIGTLTGAEREAKRDDLKLKKEELIQLTKEESSVDKKVDEKMKKAEENANKALGPVGELINAKEAKASLEEVSSLIQKEDKLLEDFRYKPSFARKINKGKEGKEGEKAEPEFLGSNSMRGVMLGAKIDKEEAENNYWKGSSSGQKTAGQRYLRDELTKIETDKIKLQNSAAGTIESDEAVSQRAQIAVGIIMDDLSKANSKVAGLDQAKIKLDSETRVKELIAKRDEILSKNNGSAFSANVLEANQRANTKEKKSLEKAIDDINEELVVLEKQMDRLVNNRSSDTLLILNKGEQDKLKEKLLEVSKDYADIKIKEERVSKQMEVRKAIDGIDGEMNSLGARNTALGWLATEYSASNTQNQVRENNLKIVDFQSKIDKLSKELSPVEKDFKLKRGESAPFKLENKLPAAQELLKEYQKAGAGKEEGEEDPTVVESPSFTLRTRNFKKGLELSSPAVSTLKLNKNTAEEKADIDKAIEKSYADVQPSHGVKENKERIAKLEKELSNSSLGRLEQEVKEAKLSAADSFNNQRYASFEPAYQVVARERKLLEKEKAQKEKLLAVGGGSKEDKDGLEKLEKNKKEVILREKYSQNLTQGLKLEQEIAILTEKAAELKSGDEFGKTQTDLAAKMEELVNLETEKVDIRKNLGMAVQNDAVDKGVGRAMDYSAELWSAIGNSQNLGGQYAKERSELNASSSDIKAGKLEVEKEKVEDELEKTGRDNPFLRIPNKISKKEEKLAVLGAKMSAEKKQLNTAEEKWEEMIDVGISLSQDKENNENEVKQMLTSSDYSDLGKSLDGKALADSLPLLEKKTGELLEQAKSMLDGPEKAERIKLLEENKDFIAGALGTEKAVDTLNNNMNLVGKDVSKAREKFSETAEESNTVSGDLNWLKGLIASKEINPRLSAQEKEHIPELENKLKKGGELKKLYEQAAVAEQKLFKAMFENEEKGGKGDHPEIAKLLGEYMEARDKVDIAKDDLYGPPVYGDRDVVRENYKNSALVKLGYRVIGTLGDKEELEQDQNVGEFILRDYNSNNKKSNEVAERVEDLTEQINLLDSQPETPENSAKRKELEHSLEEVSFTAPYYDYAAGRDLEDLNKWVGDGEKRIARMEKLQESINPVDPLENAINYKYLDMEHSSKSNELKKELKVLKVESEYEYGLKDMETLKLGAQISDLSAKAAQLEPGTAEFGKTQEDLAGKVEKLVNLETEMANLKKDFGTAGTSEDINSRIKDNVSKAVDFGEKINLYNKLTEEYQKEKSIGGTKLGEFNARLENINKIENQVNEDVIPVLKQQSTTLLDEKTALVNIEKKQNAASAGAEVEFKQNDARLSAIEIEKKELESSKKDLGEKLEREENRRVHPSSAAAKERGIKDLNNRLGEIDTKIKVLKAEEERLEQKNSLIYSAGKLEDELYQAVQNGGKVGDNGATSAELKERLVSVKLEISGGTEERKDAIAKSIDNRIADRVKDMENSGESGLAAKYNTPQKVADRSGEINTEVATISNTIGKYNSFTEKLSFDRQNITKEKTVLEGKINSINDQISTIKANKETLQGLIGANLETERKANDQEIARLKSEIEKSPVQQYNRAVEVKGYRQELDKTLQKDLTNKQDFVDTLASADYFSGKIKDLEKAEKTPQNDQEIEKLKTAFSDTQVKLASLVKDSVDIEEDKARFTSLINNGVAPDAAALDKIVSDNLGKNIDNLSKAGTNIANYRRQADEGRPGLEKNNKDLADINEQLKALGLEQVEAGNALSKISDYHKGFSDEISKGMSDLNNDTAPQLKEGKEKFKNVDVEIAQLEKIIKDKKDKLSGQLSLIEGGATGSIKKLAEQLSTKIKKDEGQLGKLKEEKMDLMMNNFSLSERMELRDELFKAMSSGKPAEEVDRIRGELVKTELDLIKLNNPSANDWYGVNTVGQLRNVAISAEANENIAERKVEGSMGEISKLANLQKEVNAVGGVVKDLTVHRDDLTARPGEDLSAQGKYAKPLVEQKNVFVDKGNKLDSDIIKAEAGVRIWEDSASVGANQAIKNNTQEITALSGRITKLEKENSGAIHSGELKAKLKNYLQNDKDLRELKLAEISKIKIAVMKDYSGASKAGNPEKLANLIGELAEIERVKAGLETRSKGDAVNRISDKAFSDTMVELSEIETGKNVENLKSYREAQQKVDEIRPAQKIYTALQEKAGLELISSALREENLSPDVLKSITTALEDNSQEIKGLGGEITALEKNNPGLLKVIKESAGSSNYPTLESALAAKNAVISAEIQKNPLAEYYIPQLIAKNQNDFADKNGGVSIAKTVESLEDTKSSIRRGLIPDKDLQENKKALEGMKSDAEDELKRLTKSLESSEGREKELGSGNGPELRIKALEENIKKIDEELRYNDESRKSLTKRLNRLSERGKNLGPDPLDNVRTNNINEKLSNLDKSVEKLVNEKTLFKEQENAFLKVKNSESDYFKAKVSGKSESELEPLKKEVVEARDQLNNILTSYSSDKADEVKTAGGRDSDVNGRSLEGIARIYREVKGDSYVNILDKRAELEKQQIELGNELLEASKDYVDNKTREEQMGAQIGARKAIGGIQGEINKLGSDDINLHSATQAQTYAKILEKLPSARAELSKEIDILNDQIESKKSTEGTLKSYGWIPVVGAITNMAALSSDARSSGRQVDLPDMFKGGIVNYQVNRMRTTQKLTDEDKVKLRGFITSSEGSAEDRARWQKALDEGVTEKIDSVYRNVTVAGVAQPIDYFSNAPLTDMGISSNIRRSGVVPEFMVAMSNSAIEETKKINKDRLDKIKTGSPEEQKKAEDAILDSVDKINAQLPQEKRVDRDFIKKELSENGNTEEVAGKITNLYADGIKNIVNNYRTIHGDAGKAVTWIPEYGADGKITTASEAKRQELVSLYTNLENVHFYSPESSLVKRTTVDRFGHMQESSYYGKDYDAQSGNWQDVKLDKTTDYYYNQFGLALTKDKDYTQIKLPAKWESEKEVKVIREAETKMVDPGKPYLGETIPGKSEVVEVPPIPKLGDGEIIPAIDIKGAEAVFAKEEKGKKEDNRGPIRKFTDAVKELKNNPYSEEAYETLKNTPQEIKEGAAEVAKSMKGEGVPIDKTKEFVKAWNLKKEEAENEFAKSVDRINGLPEAEREKEFMKVGEKLALVERDWFAVTEPTAKILEKFEGKAQKAKNYMEKMNEERLDEVRGEVKSVMESRYLKEYFLQTPLPGQSPVLGPMDLAREKAEKVYAEEINRIDKLPESNEKQAAFDAAGAKLQAEESNWLAVAGPIKDMGKEEFGKIVDYSLEGWKGFKNKKYFDNNPARFTAFVLEMVIQESRGNPQAGSSKAAVGLMQFKDSTFREQERKLKIKNGETPIGDDGRTDPQRNISAGINYLDGIIDKVKTFSPDGTNNKVLGLALAGYNAGPNRESISRGEIPNITETKGYVRDILQNYNRDVAKLEAKEINTTPSSSVVEINNQSTQIIVPEEIKGDNKPIIMSTSDGGTIIVNEKEHSLPTVENLSLKGAITVSDAIRKGREIAEESKHNIVFMGREQLANIEGALPPSLGLSTMQNLTTGYPPPVLFPIVSTEEVPKVTPQYVLPKEEAKPLELPLASQAQPKFTVKTPDMVIQPDPVSAPEVITTPAQSIEIERPLPAAIGGVNTTYTMNIYKTGAGVSPFNGPSRQITARDINSGPELSPGLHYSISPAYMVSVAANRAAADFSATHPYHQNIVKIDEYIAAREKELEGKTVSSKEDEELRSVRVVRESYERAIKEDFEQTSDGKVFVGLQDKISKADAEKLQTEFIAKHLNKEFSLPVSHNTADEKLRSQLRSSFGNVKEVSEAEYVKIQGRDYVLPKSGSVVGYDNEGRERFSENRNYTYNRQEIGDAISTTSKKLEAEGNNAPYQNFLSKVAVRKVDEKTSLVATPNNSNALQGLYQSERSVKTPVDFSSILGPEVNTRDKTDIGGTPVASIHMLQEVK